MDLHLHGASLAEGLRLQQIDRGSGDGRLDWSTPDHHRPVRSPDIVFAVLLVLSAIAGLVLLAA